MANIKVITDALDATIADRYRLLQAQKMIDLFKKVRGREPSNTDELAKFLEAEVKAGRLPPGPIEV